MVEKKTPRTAAEIMKSVERNAARKKKDRERRAAEVAARKPGEGYESCIVSFIDILGFRDLLATRHADDIVEILQMLREFTKPDERKPRRMKDARLHSRSFAESVSDAVVRVRVFDTQYRDGAFFHEVLDLLHAQVRCVGNGVLIRAGLTIGDAHVGLDGTGPVFGPAMVRAYEIESSEAVQPRIVVDEAAYEMFETDARLHKEGHSSKEEASYVDRMLRLDGDGTRFIDYLCASESEFDHAFEYFSFLEQHGELVRERLAVAEGRVRTKFEWLAAYHNEVVDDVRKEFSDGVRSAEAFGVETGLDAASYFENMRVTA
ncbi:hypothetical protein E3U23_07495 [Erythrobacter litoralis]|uniref:hypothetical protein n=1 Tax=Erythrobacter litoralis TaxID=39960 RepID=UPI002435F1D1|nr:hypothetical protein [Erythrobacter litoralis]MDG6079034.1 hypothetical protein [Erythrobacter litoralis]